MYNLYQNISNNLDTNIFNKLDIDPDDKKHMIKILLNKLMHIVNTIIQSGWSDLLNDVLIPLTQKAQGKLNRGNDGNNITKVQKN